MAGAGAGEKSRFWSLEALGRIQLSPNFYLRDFLYSEIAATYAVSNVPDDVELAVQTGRRLCETILEPLQATFGRIHIRSGYRSASLNALGNAQGLKCARNAATYADHIWDVRDEAGRAGACACVVVPWFNARYPHEQWPRLAWWLYDHLLFHRVVVFSRQGAFNIGWRDEPAREVSSYLEPKGVLVGPRRPPDPGRASLYAGFPPFQDGRSA